MVRSYDLWASHGFKLSQNGVHVKFHGKAIRSHPAPHMQLAFARCASPGKRGPVSIWMTAEALKPHRVNVRPPACATTILQNQAAYVLDTWTRLSPHRLTTITPPDISLNLDDSHHFSPIVEQTFPALDTLQVGKDS